MECHSIETTHKNSMEIAQFRYFKILPKTINPSVIIVVYSPEPCAEVYCLRLNMNINNSISKLGYSLALYGELMKITWNSTGTDC